MWRGRIGKSLTVQRRRTRQRSPASRKACHRNVVTGADSRTRPARSAPPPLSPGRPAGARVQAGPYRRSRRGSTTTAAGADLAAILVRKKREVRHPSTPIAAAARARPVRRIGRTGTNAAKPNSKLPSDRLTIAGQAAALLPDRPVRAGIVRRKHPTERSDSVLARIRSGVPRRHWSRATARTVPNAAISEPAVSKAPCSSGYPYAKRAYGLKITKPWPLPRERSPRLNPPPALHREDHKSWSEARTTLRRIFPGFIRPLTMRQAHVMARASR